MAPPLHRLPERPFRTLSCLSLLHTESVPSTGQSYCYRDITPAPLKLRMSDFYDQTEIRHG